MTLQSPADAPTQAFREAAQTHEPAHAPGPDNLGPGRVALPYPAAHPGDQTQPKGPHKAHPMQNYSVI